MANTASENQTPASSMKEKWGIAITGLKMTADGHMLDFRFKVVDAEKARPIFKRQTKPYLIDQASGKALRVPKLPKIGSLRTSSAGKRIVLATITGISFQLVSQLLVNLGLMLNINPLLTTLLPIVVILLLGTVWMRRAL